MLDKPAPVGCLQVGTPDFVAPEVLTCRPPPSSAAASASTHRGYTVSCDVWAVGVLAWELLAGKAPFHAATTEDIKENVRAGKCAAMPADWSAAPREFVIACMARNPQQRPSAEALLEHAWLRAPP